MNFRLIFIASMITLLGLAVGLHQGRLSAKSLIYTSPRPQATLVPTNTSIILNYGEAVDPATLTGQIWITGDKSGLHPGSARLAADGLTIIFNPDTPFLPQEEVWVIIQSGIETTAGTPLMGTTFQFTTTPKQIEEPYRSAALNSRLPNLMAVPPRQSKLPASTGDVTAGLFTLPSDYPPITITVPATNTADGYIFLSNFSIDWSNFGFTSSRPFLLILDNTGEPVFFRSMPPPNPILDFKKQPDGRLTYGVWGGIFYVLDNSYNLVDTYAAGNGYPIDIHDLQFLANGHALVMIYDAQPVDMSQIVPGGDPNAIVVGLVIQELDINKNVVFQWRSWDHIPITDTNANLEAAVIDYMHGNSVALDTDGNLLISSRAIDEVTKIDRQTGEIIWRLGGGRGNEFTFINDETVPFIGQHDARRLANGHMTIFDNRFKLDSTFSRAVEYEIDEIGKTAEPVWQFHGVDPSPAMGNTQRLPNGNTLIGWGSLYPTLTEVMPDGEIALEMQFSPMADPAIVRNSYRAFRFPWEGFPTTSPRLAVHTATTDGVDLYFSWNGATQVQAYLVKAGNSLATLQHIATEPKTGFETRYDVVAGDNYCLYQVTPVLDGANLGPPSNIGLADHCLKTKLHFPFITHAGG